MAGAGHSHLYLSLSLFFFLDFFFIWSKTEMFLRRPLVAALWSVVSIWLWLLLLSVGQVSRGGGEGQFFNQRTCNEAAGSGV